MRRRTRVSILSAVLLLAACTNEARPTASSAGPSQAVDCGTEQYGFGSGYDGAKRECLWSAFVAGKPATFTSVHRATEGALLTYVATVAGPAKVEVRFENGSTDANGGRFSYSCGTLERRPINDQPSRMSFAATHCSGRGPEVVF